MNLKIAASLFTLLATSTCFGQFEVFLTTVGGATRDDAIVRFDPNGNVIGEIDIDDFDSPFGIATDNESLFVGMGIPEFREYSLDGMLIDVNPALSSNSSNLYMEISLSGDLFLSDLDGPVYRVGPDQSFTCLLYTSPSPRDATLSRMPSSA